MVLTYQAKEKMDLTRPISGCKASSVSIIRSSVACRMACKPTGRDGKASSAPSSRPSTTNRLRGRWKHDVFLSFHGETRTKFADHLYNNLKDAGVNVFRDDEGLQRGEEISSLFDAIRGSRVSVVVFSEYYAASTWCLEELATIMECWQALGQLVLPVFYDVHPSDVRRQSGSFMTAFHNHEQRFALEKDTVARWKAAATQAGNLSGWDLRNATYRSVYNWKFLHSFHHLFTLD